MSVSGIVSAWSPRTTTVFGGALVLSAGVRVTIRTVPPTPSIIAA
jgi:hypothetical protein